LVIPADLTKEQTAEVQRLAVGAFQAVDCAGLARVDFFVEDGTGRVLLNEINTMPGFTSISMYPKLWEASGLSYPKLIKRLIELALERHAEKKATKFKR
jgi:D-alanine-D-alanine ligase